MRLDQNPFFRRAIIPWYDSNLACSIFIAISVCTLIFSLIGIKVALTEPDFGNFVWLPSVMAILSLFVMIKIMLKLIKRRQTI